MHRTDDTTGSWPAPWFQHPARTELVSGHHLRPLRAADHGLPGLPDGLDLGPATTAAAARAGYVYGVFDDEERSVLGVVRLAPGDDPAYDVHVRWAVSGSASLAAVVEAHLPGWLARCWPFTSPRVVADAE